MAKLIKYRLLLLLILCYDCFTAQSQDLCRLIIQSTDSPAVNIESLKLTTTFNNSNACYAYVQQLPALLAAKGYISASVDSIRQDSAHVFIQLFAGKKYVWDQLMIAEADRPLLQQLGYSIGMFNSKPFDEKTVTGIYTRLLDYFANNGYPFARVSLDSISIHENDITAKLRIAAGSVYHIDTMIVHGDVKLSKPYLSRYLGVEEKTLYRQEALDRINARLAELPFIVQTQPYRVTMLNTGAALDFYLQNRRSNQINVLVGFLPSNPQVGGKLLVTGEANLNLRNPFGNGEVLGINWQQLQAKSPRLNLLFQRPYLFKTRLGTNVNFELYKRDSLFLNIHGQLGAQYNVSTRKSIMVALQLYRTNVLTVDTAYVKTTKRLPNTADISSTTLSFQYDYNSTNYRFNPRKGNEIQFVVGFGQKNIRRNNAILAIKDPSFNYAALYDTVQQRAYVVRSTINAAHYFPIGKQATFKTALQGGWLQSPNYYDNELFQIGGFKKLRGFDEESIYTNRFLIATLEYRYLLAQNSWLFAFTDIGRAAYKSNSVNDAHTYIGFGAGLAFETNSGIFNLSWALGKRNDLNLDLRQSKIHIGFVSLF